MNLKIKSSIFLKTLSYLILFCITTFLLLYLFEILFIKSYYKYHQIKVVKDIVGDINTKSSYEEIEDLAYDKNVCISVYDDFGDVKEYNNRLVGCALNTPEVKKIIYDYFNDDKENKSFNITIKNSSKGFLYAVTNNDSDIFIYAPIEMDSVHLFMQNQLIYIIIIMIIIACAISIFISNLITKPIYKIINRTKKIGKENYNTTFYHTGIREIDELNNTLNLVQEELGKVNTYQKDLLANVTHDLKTPLTMIEAYAEKIKDISYKDYDKLESDANIIIDEVKRLTNLVNDILDLSKYQNNAEILNYENYDLVSEIKNILKRYEIIKETENYVFNLDLPESLNIYADKAKINQVIYNLINNAINYTGKDKNIYIKLVSYEKNYILKIIDTGKGIKKDEIPYIWTKYYKNTKNHKRDVVSTGLGLSIVKEILEKHNFEYGVETGKNGTTFYFIIPSQKGHLKIINKL